MGGQKRLYVRGAIALLLTMWMLSGLVYEQFFQRESAVLRSWVMFSGIGKGVVDASFYKRVDGELIKLEYRSLLNTTSDIQNEKHALFIAKRLCEVLGPENDVRLFVRRAGSEGWMRIFSGEKNMCV